MKHRKAWKRTLAALLTLAMALGVVPMTAFAEETSQAAADASAMEALESRVFTIADEEYTIEDLEEFSSVLVSTPDVELMAVSGDEIREFLLANPRATTQGTITLSIARTGSTTAQITMRATCTRPIVEITGCAFCSDPGQNYYYFKLANIDENGNWQPVRLAKPIVQSTNITISLTNFSLTTGTSVKYGYHSATIYYKDAANRTKSVDVESETYSTVTP